MQTESYTMCSLYLASFSEHNDFRVHPRQSNILLQGILCPILKILNKIHKPQTMQLMRSRVWVILLSFVSYSITFLNSLKTMGTSSQTKVQGSYYRFGAITHEGQRGCVRASDVVIYVFLIQKCLCPRRYLGENGF